MKNEYTINEAIKMCKKDGRMRRIDDPEGWIDKSDFSDREFYFTVKDAEMLWIYEPPKKSAFQEWNDKTPYGYGEEHHCTVLKDGRKQGWNAHHEAVSNIISQIRSKSITLSREEFEKLRKL
jgi:hypothetical protein